MVVKEPGAWAIKHSACVGCETTTREHIAFGRCRSCYDKHIINNKRARRRLFDMKKETFNRWNKELIKIRSERTGKIVEIPIFTDEIVNDEMLETMKRYV